MAAGKSPHIVCVGANEKAISQYFIVLDAKLLPTNSELDFFGVFDLLFKSHFTFNLKFDENINAFWLFIQNYFYEIYSKKTNRVTEIISKFDLIIPKSM